FVWSGDILVPYAMAAFAMLLLFRNTPPSRTWKWGVAMYGALSLLMLLGALGLAAAALDPEAAAAMADPETAATFAALRAGEVAAYATGSYAEATAFRWEFFLAGLSDNAYLVPMVVGMFLVGAWLVGSGVMADPATHRRLFARLAWWGTGVGLALTLASVSIDPVLAVDPAAPTASQM